MHVLIQMFNKLCLVVLCCLVTQFAQAQADLEVSTPEITAIKSSMKKRHQLLSGFYSSGAVGLTQDGKVALRDPKAAALKDRGKLKGLVSAENTDRQKLYNAIAQANGHPEWQADIQTTFAKRWIDKARAGWFYQQSGQWVKK